MLYEAEHLAQILERPLKTQQLIGSPITITMSPGALKALATAIRALGGAASESFTQEQIREAMKMILGHASLLGLIRLWALMRFQNWLMRL